jgi:UDP:flavonoid glycosyltransferase YjiC (YdhE family)
VADASPFSYACAISPTLNVCAEPPEFLPEHEQRALDPVAFYGCLRSAESARRPGGDADPPFGPDSQGTLKVYVSFGTVIWRYFTSEALQTLATLAAAFGRLEHVRAIFSLGGAPIDGVTLAGLVRPNVVVERYVDQWRVLGDADLFVTHHGLNSTHEAIFMSVPMLSYPFFWDQPALAERCQELGLALPLTGSLRGVVGAADVAAALQRVTEERPSLLAALARARGWELAVMQRREDVLDRIAAVAATAAPRGR